MEITEFDILNYATPPQPVKSTSDMFEQYEKLQDFKEFAEKEFIIRKLKKNNWNITKTATELDIQRSHLYNKIERYNLNKENFTE